VLAVPGPVDASTSGGCHEFARAPYCVEVLKIFWRKLAGPRLTPGKRQRPTPLLRGSTKVSSASGIFLRKAREPWMSWPNTWRWVSQRLPAH
jgi:hypothetical protein